MEEPEDKKGRCIRLYNREMTYTDYMCQAKEEEDAPAMKITRFINSTTRRRHKKEQKRLITVTRNSTGNIKINRKTTTMKQK